MVGRDDWSNGVVREGAKNREREGARNGEREGRNREREREWREGGTEKGMEGGRA